MKIGLLGYTFCNENKGCEALTYAFVQMLSETFNSSGKLEIVNLGLENNEGLGNLPAYFPNISFEFFNIKLKDLSFSYFEEFRKCDFIFDITYGDNFSDIYMPKFVFKTTMVKQMVIWSKTPLILAPQTYGPFSNKYLEKFAAKVIKKSNAVFTRDKLSAQYVHKITGTVPRTVTDVAFALPHETYDFEAIDKVRVGLNVSGLLWRGGFEKENQFGLKLNYKDYILELIEVLLKKGHQVHLIPHVIATSETISTDDDYLECYEINKIYPATILSPKFISPIEVKSYISQMDVFLGARMHSTIAAFSSGVPTIPFAYSRKFEGLYFSLGYVHIIDGLRLDNKSALKQSIQYIEGRSTLMKDQQKAMRRVHRQLGVFKNMLTGILK